MDLEDFELPLSEDVQRGGEIKRLRSYVFNKKADTWAAAGLSYAALWAWDVLAAHWRRRHLKCNGRVPVDADVKRKIALRDNEALRRVLNELADHGLIAFEPGRGRAHRLTYVNVDCRRDPLAEQTSTTRQSNDDD